MDQAWITAISAAGAVIFGRILWTKIARGIGNKILDRIKNEKVKGILSKNLGGYY